MVDQPSIVECHDVTGDDNYILKAHMTSLDDLRDLLARIRTLPPVTQTRTAISLARVKDQGLVRLQALANGEEDASQA